MSGTVAALAERREQCGGDRRAAACRLVVRLRVTLAQARALIRDDYALGIKVERRAA